MKKIIAAFDGLSYSESTTKYSTWTTKINNAFLVGLFLDDIVHHSYKLSDVLSEQGKAFNEKLRQLDNNDKKSRNNSVNLFENECQQEKINYSVHRDRNIALEDLLHECTYGDLLVMDKSLNFDIYSEHVPSDFVRNVLSEVQCPVLIVPKKFKPVKRVVFLYDGLPSSVYSIKMFNYLIPVNRSVHLDVLTVRNDEHSNHLPNEYLMKDLMRRHFPDAEYTVLKGHPKEAIYSFVQKMDDALLVLGSYHRGSLSRWLKPSMADYLISNLNLPLFISHGK